MTHDRHPSPVDALLGPSEAEATCDECFARLDVYAEREAASGDAASTMPRLAAHLRGCPACAEDLESLVALLVADARARRA